MYVLLYFLGDRSKSSVESKLCGVGTALVVKRGGLGNTWPDALPAKDDLRAYAYEGEGSSAGSLSSALAGDNTLLFCQY